jgi:hypothetical protein
MELRNAFLHFGGSLTAPFLQLDREIEDFASQCRPEPGTMAGTTRYVGANAGLSEQLSRIEQQAKSLRYEAGRGMKLCRDRLAEGKRRSQATAAISGVMG